MLQPGNRNQRKATWDEKKNPDGRWRVFTYDEIVARDKCSLDIFWLKDESLEDSANLPEPHVLAAEVADDLRSALSRSKMSWPISSAVWAGSKRSSRRCGEAIARVDTKSNRDVAYQGSRSALAR